jgi:predicted TIM-barrel fold metal-dependent hydrolase
MGYRLSWLQRRLGVHSERIADTCVFASPNWQKASDLLRPAGETSAVRERCAEEMEDARLSDLIEDMDRARVTASLVVLHEKVDELLRLARQHSGRLFGSAYFESRSPREGLERVQGLFNEHPELILGITTAMPRFGQDPRLRDFVPLYEFCVERLLPVQFYAGSDSTEENASLPMALAVLARSYPRLKVVCQYQRSWPREALALFNRFANVFLQVDGVSLHTLLCATDSRKLLFGSDWRGREPGYFERIEAVRRLPWRQRRNVSWRTAIRVYGPRMFCHSVWSDTQSSSR